MKRIALLVGLLVVMVTFGCEKKEQASAPEKAAEKVEQTAGAVAEKTAEVAAQAEQKAAEVATATATATEAVAEKAAEVAQAPAAAVEQVAEAGKEAVAAGAATVAGAAAVVEQKATEAAATTAAVVEEKAAAVAEAVAPAASGDSIVIENTYGKVTFNHKVHSEAFDCATCHGEGEPGALDMGKDKAHAACKGCHQEKAAGPTKCSECHVK